MLPTIDRPPFSNSWHLPIIGQKRSLENEDPRIGSIAKQVFSSSPQEEISDLECIDFLRGCLSPLRQETEIPPNFSETDLLDLERSIDSNLPLFDEDFFDENSCLEKYNRKAPIDLEPNPVDPPKGSTLSIYSDTIEPPNPKKSRRIPTLLFDTIGKLLGINPNQPFSGLSAEIADRLPIQTSGRSKHLPLVEIINTILYREINQCEWKEVPTLDGFVKHKKTIEKWQRRISYNEKKFLSKIKNIVSRSLQKELKKNSH